MTILKKIWKYFTEPRGRDTLVPLEPSQSETTETPCLIVYGNCNATAISQFVSMLGLFKGDVIWARSYGDETGASDKDLARCQVLWAQYDPGNPLQYEGRLNPSAKVVSFPPLNSTVLWPFQARDPLSSDQPGGFPYGDKFIMEMSEDKTIDAQEAWGLYEKQAKALQDTLDAAALNDANLMRERDSHCDVKVADFYLKNYQSTRMSMSFNHPTKYFLIYLLEQLVVKTFGAAKWQSVQGIIKQWPDEYEPLDSVELPISQVVADHFGISWWSPTNTLRFYGARISPQDYMTRAVSWRRERLHTS